MSLLISQLSAALRVGGFAGKLAGLMMKGWLSRSGRGGEGRLWLLAFGWSLLINLGLLLVLGLGLLESHLMGRRNEAKAVLIEPVLTIVPEIAASVVAPETQKDRARPRFARTSDEQQASEPVKDAPFIGERSTRAASDQASVPTAPAQPSQRGVKPRDANDIETTQSKYQDGKLTEPSKPRESQRTTETATPSLAEREKKSATPPAAPTSPRSGLVQGPNPVDVAVSAEEIKKPIAPEKPPQEAVASSAEAPKPAAEPKKDKEFRGNQRKTAMVGSISRSGPSALEVADTPLGRYQATISRAVEIEWQRNCVRHRDFITPGFLTVRFFVETSGKVRSVQFVGDMETGEVQKGFTLNAIRKAAIPPMPNALRKDYDDEPLELMFRFYF